MDVRLVAGAMTGVALMSAVVVLALWWWMDRKDRDARDELLLRRLRKDLGGER